MNVLGTGLVCAAGRGVEAATCDAPEAEFIEVPFRDTPFPVFAVARETLKDRQALGGMRRADRFCKMAMLASYDAIAQQGGELPDPERVGIILATAFGPHCTTFKFLDDILNYGDAGVSPTIFSSSVHNAANSYVSRAFNITGPTHTLTHFTRAFEQAAILAEAWLAEQRCDQILLIAGDELGMALEYIASQKLDIAEDGCPKEGRYVPGEGAAAFLLDNAEGTELNTNAPDSASRFGNMLTGQALDSARFHLAPEDCA